MVLDLPFFAISEIPLGFPFGCRAKNIPITTMTKKKEEVVCVSIESINRLDVI
jgi:hypothetical protein